MTDELKPCPFCGGEAETCSYYFEEKNMTLWQVRCKERPYVVEHPCYTADSFISFATEAEAIEAWNTRAESTCNGVFKGTHRGWEPALFCSECGTELLGKFCHECGAKVVE